MYASSSRAENQLSNNIYIIYICMYIYLFELWGPNDRQDKLELDIYYIISQHHSHLSP